MWEHAMTPFDRLTSLEEKVATAVRGARQEIVDLASTLIGFDTTARNPGDEPRDEAALQGHLADRLRSRGAAIDLWEPPPTPPDSRFLPPSLDFTGRPQMAATFPGTGGGRSLMLNGHIDAVAPDPVERWTTPPLQADVRHGRLYGRGANDMKGGIAALVVAAETLSRLGVRLKGDLVVCTNTDEESSGAGGFAMVERGIKADACIVAEPSDFQPWISCRGTVTPTITIPGRAGHAEVRQPHWRDGGAVNAIEKTAIVLEAVRRLRDEWRDRADQQHPLLPPGDIVPTLVNGGHWLVTYPASCDLVCDITYLPAMVDDEGTGRSVEREVTDWLNAAALTDPWLAENPLAFTWTCDVVPAEIPADHPLVTLTLETGSQCGRPGAIGALDSWHDAATFTRWGGTPSFSYGPGGFNTAHAVDEYVPVQDLVDLSVIYALVAMRFCGLSETAWPDPC
jgi:acetylornithine deacetylase